MAKAKIQKPLASYYVGGHKQTIAGVPCRFARPPVGPEDRAARTAGGRGLGGLSRLTHPSDVEAVKAWKARPLEERMALQDAALAPFASLAPSPEMPPAEISPAECAPAAEAPNPPPESVSALGGAESEPDAAIEPDAPVETGPDDEFEPVSDPMQAPEPVEGAPSSLADMIRAMADKIEALEARALAAEADAAALREKVRLAEEEEESAHANAVRLVGNVRRHRDGRRRALLALRGKRLLLRRAVAQCAEHVATRMPNAEYARVLRERDEAREQLQIAKSQIMCLESRPPAPAPVAPVAPPPADPVAVKRQLLREMGLDSGWRITGAVQPMNVQVRPMVAA